MLEGYFAERIASDAIGDSIAKGLVEATTAHLGEENIASVVSSVVENFGPKLIDMRSSIEKDVKEAFSTVIPTIKTTFGIVGKDDKSTAMFSIGSILFTSLIKGISDYD